MGGLILIFLMVLAIVILVTPALRARKRAEEERTSNTAHEEVLRRLDAHRKWRDADDDAKGRE